jgi:beta-aspartyl-peptidase (threonine type)
MSNGKSARRFVLVIHGGAGPAPAASMTADQVSAHCAVLKVSLQAGQCILAAGGASLDAVVAAIKVLEDSPLFNAAHGATLNHEGEAELDAAIMDGSTRRAGAVAVARRIRNPIEGARAIMEHSPHVLLAGDGADRFAREQGVRMALPRYFVTEARREQWKEARLAASSAARPVAPMEGRLGTVGAVALDRDGNLASGTSTGGRVDKLVGRVGDSPLIGAGTYASNQTCAVSATGDGEFFIRGVVAYDVAALMEYKGLSLARAAGLVVRKKIPALGGQGGLIAVDREGNIALPFNTERMYRGYVREGGRLFTAVS